MLHSKYVGAFALAGMGYQQMWEFSRNFGIPCPGKSTFYRYLGGDNGLWKTILREADKSMASVREEMSKRDIPAKYVTVDGRWSHVREGEWCTVSFMDIPSRKILYCVTTRKGVDDKSSVRLERVAFDRGVDELKLLGFDVKGIISDQGTTFRGAAAERKLDHQVDWWHVKRTLYNLFCKELQDQVRKAVEVDKASCIEELWLAKVEDLRQWLRTKGLEKEAKGTLKASLVEAVCEAMVTIAYVKMTPDEAKWMFPELRKVRRLGGERAVVDVPVGYGEVRPDTTGEMQPIVRDDAVDEADAGTTQVDVQWADVEELWQYDIHPVRGARPSSLASSLIVHAHAGACSNLRFIGGTTPWANVDEATETMTGCNNDGVAGETDNQGSDVGENLPRWTGRRKRKRGGDEINAGNEESTVAQRFASHFFHVMMRCAALLKAGTPMTPEDVAREIGTAPNHWAGDHSECGRNGSIPPRCVTEKWGRECALYEPGSETHKAVLAWFKKRLSPDKVKPYVHGANSSINESFHSLIIKYAAKRIRFKGSLEARVGLAVLHWNNSMDRLVTSHRTRVRQVTRVRRGNKDRILGPMDWSWVDRIMEDWQRSLGFGVDDEIMETAPKRQAQHPVDLPCGGRHPSVVGPVTPVREGGIVRGITSTRGAGRRILCDATNHPR
ncbi:unnamed protein product [Closterium sp. Yama58-4]|nr:unnamed protein product [Closterium sp. Yama58-4]